MHIYRKGAGSGAPVLESSDKAHPDTGECVPVDFRLFFVYCSTNFDRQIFCSFSDSASF